MRQERHFYVNLTVSPSKLLSRGGCRRTLPARFHPWRCAPIAVPFNGRPLFRAETTLGTAVCIRKDGSSARPGDDIWPLVVQGWIDSLEKQYPSLTGHRILMLLGEAATDSDAASDDEPAAGDDHGEGRQ